MAMESMHASWRCAVFETFGFEDVLLFRGLTGTPSCRRCSRGHSECLPGGYILEDHVLRVQELFMYERLAGVDVLEHMCAGTSLGLTVLFFILRCCIAGAGDISGSKPEKTLISEQFSHMRSETVYLLASCLGFVAEWCRQWFFLSNGSFARSRRGPCKGNLSMHPCLKREGLISVVLRKPQGWPVATASMISTITQALGSCWQIDLDSAASFTAVHCC